ncbi:MAG: hypothetical protein AB7D07_01965 [Desulfovibrionaceae bacterium]
MTREAGSHRSSEIVKKNPIRRTPLLEEFFTFDHRHLIAVKALFDLDNFYQGHTQHRPSRDMWMALCDLAFTMEDMVNGRCEPNVYLSSLDPGIGKTQTITRFIRALMQSDQHQDAGVLLCLSRLDEIKTMVHEMGLSKQDFAIFTSDPELNAQGIDEHTEARVLFTTQQMLEKRCDGLDSFYEAEQFHFMGKPRPLRLWDESFLPGIPVTLSRDDIGHLLKYIRYVSPALAADIDDLHGELKDVEDGAVYFVPDFAEKHGFYEAESILYALKKTPNGGGVQTALTTLWRMFGKSVSVRVEGKYGNTVLDYREAIPEDIRPLIVLDASGRVRGTYMEWEMYRGGLVRLDTAEKSYRNLTVNVWDTGGGKDAFDKKGDVLTEGIATTINLKPDEEWLVICHKPREGKHGFDVEASVSALLDGVDRNRVHFVTWGNHHATNQYAHVENVILAGTLFLKPAHYEALWRASADLGAEQANYPKTSRKRIESGEHAHLILQALCRSSVRRCQGDVCAPCTAYIIASSQSGIRGLLPDIFPECRIQDWRPIKKELTGRTKEAFDVIIDQIEARPSGDVVTFKEIHTLLGMSRQYFIQLRKRDDLRQALHSRGIVEHKPKKNATGFRQRTGEDYGFDAVV